ncbi:glycosyltransferase family protein [Hymenobacter jeollabukensis]|uniref:Glycosyltransferase family 39 protein n=1 Tax=Hymenobacter jeollabukensis TaxID=2025313 RepID=A0A5R8WV00_9BACT|nr:glycosyltransferase family 39 protein [Hymenobacter jeollabukensis]TLM95266.1 glycosyltransferase family 39 protein [Hymenobacter jeollabukensis]
MKSNVVFWLAAALLTLAMFQDKRWKAMEVLDSDPGGYYVYLPSAFIYGDLGRPDSLGALRHIYRPAEEPAEIGLKPLPGKRFMSKYTLGKALADLPWFLGAHAWAGASDKYAADGFSRPYQQIIMIAGLFHGILGLWILRKLLRRYYDDGTTAWALAGIGLGTNLFCYASYDANMAHAVLFLWQAALLYCSARWYETGRPGFAAGIGLFLGLAILTRPSEAMYGLVPLTWGLTLAAPALRQRAQWWWERRGQLLLAAVLLLAVVSLQALFWHAVSGHWIVYSYTGEKFDFLHPHLVEGLISFRKGWWLYTPMALLSLGGLWWLRRDVPAAWLMVLLMVPVAIYVTFSWRTWSYGGSFSCRPLVSLYPVLALPLASLLAHARWRWALRTVVVAFIVLNLWQSWQYAGGVLHWDDTTADMYFRNFFRRKL